MLLEDSSGNSYSKEGRLVGCDPSYDLAVLKVMHLLLMKFQLCESGSNFNI